MVFPVAPRYPEPQGFEYTRSLVNAELAPARAAAEALVLPALQQSEVTPALCAARTSSVLSLLDLHRSYFVEQVPEQGGSASMATSAGGLRAPASHPVLRKMKLGPTRAIIPPRTPLLEADVTLLSSALASATYASSGTWSQDEVATAAALDYNTAHFAAQRSGATRPQSRSSAPITKFMLLRHMNIVSKQASAAARQEGAAARSEGAVPSSGSGKRPALVEGTRTTRARPAPAALPPSPGTPASP